MGHGSCGFPSANELQNLTKENQHTHDDLRTAKTGKVKHYF